MSRNSIGKSGLSFAVVLFLLMALTAYFLSPGYPAGENAGVCLPSPSMWHIKPMLSWGANLLLLLVCAAGASVLNRKYNFVPGTDLMLPAALLILVGSVPADLQRISTGTLLLAVNLLSMGLLLGCRQQANNTQRLFAIGSLISLGSTVQTAFIPFAIVYPIGAAIMKALGVKDTAAYIMGIISPYWALVGLGIVNPLDFRIEWQTGLFTLAPPAKTVFIIAIGVAVTALWGIILGFDNAIRLLKANVDVRRANRIFALLGIVALLGCIFNFPDMPAFLPTLFLGASVQLANAFSLRPTPVSPFVPLVLIVAYTALFILSSGFVI